jgi:hypothetical protein
MFNQLCGQGYNELLYAHLLDSDGVRLTYTHFTAKVVGYFLCVVQYKFAKSLARSQKLASPPPPTSRTVLGPSLGNDMLEILISNERESKQESLNK